MEIEVDHAKAGPFSPLKMRKELIIYEIIYEKFQDKKYKFKEIK
jgi:hypothetical protein